MRPWSIGACRVMQAAARRSADSRRWQGPVVATVPCALPWRLRRIQWVSDEPGSGPLPPAGRRYSRTRAAAGGTAQRGGRLAGSELIAGVLRAKAVLVGFHARVIRRMLQVAMASMPTSREAACASSL